MTKHLQRFWTMLSNRGLRGAGDSLEMAARIALVYIAFLVCLLALIPYGLVALAEGSTVLGVIDLSIALVLSVLTLAFILTRNFALFSRLGIYVMGSLFVYLVVTGGIYNTGYLWAYTFPLFVLYLTGPVEGSIIVLGFFFVLILSFSTGIFPYAQSYSIHFKVRFLSSLVAVYILTNFFEYLRAKAYAAMSRKHQELQTSEQRLRDIAMSSSDIIWETDRQGRYVYLSGRVLDVLGYTPEELMGKSPFDLCPEEGLSSLRGVFHAAGKEGRGIAEVMHWYLHKNGSSVFVLTNAGPILDKEGRLTGFRGVDKDITAWKMTEEALRQSELHLRQIIDSAPFGAFVVELDAEGRLVITNSNQAADALMGLDTRAYYNKRLEEVYPGDEGATFINDIRRSMTEGGQLKLDRFGYPVNGIGRIFEIHFLPFKVTMAVIFFMDITERVEREERFKYQAEHDPLTGLANRILFMKHLQLSFSQAYSKEYLLAVLFMDLDEFKQVNDSHSHAVGDLLLKEVASRLQGSLRDSDLVSRLGGDEFAILLPFIVNRRSISPIAEKILHEVGKPYLVGGRELRITTSIGISLFPVDGQEPEELLHKADQALYKAKSVGKNSCQFYSGGLD